VRRGLVVHASGPVLAMLALCGGWTAARTSNAAARWAVVVGMKAPLCHPACHAGPAAHMIAIMRTLFQVFSSLAEREHALGQGCVLFRAGDAVRSMFVVETGLVRLVRQLPHGPALTLQLAGAGSVLAEASLFAGHYHCDAVVLKTSRLLASSRARVEEAVTHDPETARAWSEHLAAEVQRARGAGGDRVLEDRRRAPGRVACASR
jgi:CRP-like cAMP-binding protein